MRQSALFSVQWDNLLGLKYILTAGINPPFPLIHTTHHTHIFAHPMTLNFPMNHWLHRLWNCKKRNQVNKRCTLYIFKWCPDCFECPMRRDVGRLPSESFKYVFCFCVVNKLWTRPLCAGDQIPNLSKGWLWLFKQKTRSQGERVCSLIWNLHLPGDLPPASWHLV